MRIHNKVLTFIFCLMGITNSFAQQPELRIITEIDAPQFYTDIIMRAAEDSGKTEVIIFVKTIYDALQFVKEKDQFKAEYEISVSMLNNKGEQLTNKINKHTILTDSYKETNSSSDFSLSSVGFIVPSNEYEVYIELTDLDSRKSNSQKRKLIVKDYFASPLAISSVFLKNQMISDSIVFFEPNVYWNFGKNQNNVFVDFEIYAREWIDSVQVGYALTDARGDTMRHIYFHQNIQKKMTSVVLEILRDDLKLGRYQLHVYLLNNSHLIKQTHKLTIHWMDMPTFARDLDASIEQLKYITSGKIINRMKEAEDSEKARLFGEFWKVLDPTPDTDANEVMQEYYQRVQFSNENFREFRPGWKTDRGFVYILLGPPNEVEHYPFESGTDPYQVWHYYTINKTFVFIARDASGAYDLVNPVSEVLREVR